ncbi:MAG TPA: DUF3093 domain-containing protein [Trebonia sp.]|jgi:hypothetical protein|nr:DUF3093 domain-containing protein [Trebonia sp.]
MRSYRERLRVPLLWWFLAVVNILLIGSIIWAGLGGYWPALTYILLAVLVGAFLVNWELAVVEVSDGSLRAGRNALDLGEIGDVVPLSEEEAAVLRGPRADPAAHLLLRPYLKQAVYIAVADPASTVPYWLIATRRPEELAAAIEAAAVAKTGHAGRTVG